MFPVLRKLIPIRWRSNAEKPKPVRVEVVYRESSSISVQDYRKIPDLVKEAYEVLKDPRVKRMLDALKNSHIGKYGVDGFPPLETRAIIQAQGEGYSAAINDFESLGTVEVPKPDLVQTFLPENDDLQTEPS